MSPRGTILFQYGVLRYGASCSHLGMACVTDTDSSVKWTSEQSLADCNLHMLTSEDSSDVIFRVGKQGKIIRAHRYVLISRSCVFHAMFCGPLAETGDIKIPDVDASAFYELLMYLYTNTSEPNGNNIMSLLYLSKKYAVRGLQRICLTYLDKSLSPENVCIILEHAHFFDEPQLFDQALAVILENGHKLLNAEDFSHMCQLCLHKVIQCSLPKVKPEHVMTEALTWAKHVCRHRGREVTAANLRSVLGPTFYLLPFDEVDLTKQVDGVILTKLLTDDEKDFIKGKSKSFYKNQSPFQIRQTGSQHNSFDHSDSPGTRDVIFYDQYKKVAYSSTKDICGGMDFKSNTDVLLCGIYLPRPLTTGSKYHVSIQRFLSQYFLDDTEYVVKEKSDHHVVSEVILKHPLPIIKDVRYCMYVRLTGRESCVGDQQFFIGDGGRTEVTVGEVTFTRETQVYVDNCNIICGFIVKL